MQIGAKMKKILILLIILLLVGCGEKKVVDDNKLNIITTIFPQYDFTKEIVKDRANVTMLLKPGAESHSFEPSPQDIKNIENSDVFIYVGGENDHWIEEVVNDLSKKPALYRLIDMVDTVEEEIKEGMQSDHSHHHEISENDLKARNIDDFSGEFISNYSLIQEGVFDELLKAMADEEHSFDELKTEYLNSSETDFPTIKIENGSINDYKFDFYSHSVVKNEEGEISEVWFIYENKNYDDKFPKYVALSDHGEEELKHFHFIYGNDVSNILENEENTYYNKNQDIAEIQEYIFSGHSDEHHHLVDEHVWLSINNSIQIVEKLTAIYSELDPENASFYQENAQKYIEELKKLDSEYAQTIQNSKRKLIVVGDRYPFRYLSDDYNLDYFAAFSGCSVDIEADAATVKFLVDVVRNEKLPVVFKLELSDGKIASSIQEATNTEVLVLHSAHNLSKEELSEGISYIEIMKNNLENLKKALN